MEQIEGKWSKIPNLKANLSLCLTKHHTMKTFLLIKYRAILEECRCSSTHSYSGH